MEITISGLDELAEMLHPPFECPFCTDWKICGTCNGRETLALNWMAHLIHEHWERIEAARAAAGTWDDILGHFRDVLNTIAEERKAAAEQETADEPAPDEQETTETADASGN